MPTLDTLESEPPGRTSTYTPTTYKSLFTNISPDQWKSWKWQIKHRVTSFAELGEFLPLSDDEKQAILHKSKLPVAVTPYYLSLLNPNDLDDPLRKTIIPSLNELKVSKGEFEDPLGEDQQSPVPCIVHRYPDRVLFLVTKFCSVNCRFCTRSRIVGGNVCFHSSKDDLLKAIQYIKDHKEIRDVLISGGDPLTLEDAEIDWILGQVRAIDHVEMIRIGSKVPAVLPQRITPSLVNVLKKYHPLFLSLHFTHPNEMTSESIKACNMLADAGIPLGSQTVLLKGVNDDCGVLKKLFHELLKVRVKPYYLYQCDQILGSSHFRTSVQAGIDIIRNLRGFTSGYAIPSFIIDLPNGGGKIPILPEYVEYKENGELLITNYKKEEFVYCDE